MTTSPVGAQTTTILLVLEASRLLVQLDDMVHSAPGGIELFCYVREPLASLDVCDESLPQVIHGVDVAGAVVR